MRRTFLLAALFAFAVSARSASAHYLWVQVDDKKGIANLYFEGGPAPGDGQYLDRFIKRGTMWVTTTGTSKPTTVKMTDVRKGKLRWLTAKVPRKSPRSVDSYGKFGVYSYGKTEVLLHYYARHIAVTSRDELKTMAKAPHLGFVIEPRVEGGEFVFRLVFAGKPAVGKKVSVVGPGGKHNLTTNKNGEARFKADKPGRYRLHAYNQENDKSGEFEGKKYVQIRHHSTLLVTLP